MNTSPIISAKFSDYEISRTLVYETIAQSMCNLGLT
jgi:hypothetical protein